MGVHPTSEESNVRLLRKPHIYGPLVLEEGHTFLSEEPFYIERTNVTSAIPAEWRNMFLRFLEGENWKFIGNQLLCWSIPKFLLPFTTTTPL